MIVLDVLEKLIEIRPKTRIRFIEECLERLGVGSNKNKIIQPTCYILKILGKWYVVHFKEIFGLTGGSIDWKNDDIQRRNAIVRMLEEWKMIEVCNREQVISQSLIDIEVKIYKIKHSERENYNINHKININEINDEINKEFKEEKSDVRTIS
jgi:hypothetical protein